MNTNYKELNERISNTYKKMCASSDVQVKTKHIGEINALFDLLVSTVISDLQYRPELFRACLDWQDGDFDININNDFEIYCRTCCNRHLDITVKQLNNGHSASYNFSKNKLNNLSKSDFFKKECGITYID